MKNISLPLDDQSGTMRNEDLFELHQQLFGHLPRPPERLLTGDAKLPLIMDSSGSMGHDEDERLEKLHAGPFVRGGTDLSPFWAMQTTLPVRNRNRVPLVIYVTDGDPRDVDEYIDFIKDGASL